MRIWWCQRIARWDVEDKSPGRAIVIVVSAVGYTRTICIRRGICLEEASTVNLSTGRARGPVGLETAHSLSANTAAIADLDVLGIPAYSNIFQQSHN